MEIIIRDWWSSDEEEEPENAFEEAQKEYRDWIQETYNFTIKQVAISNWGSTPEDFLNYATTGGDENYIFVLRLGSELVSAMNSGLMYDLSTLDCLDFSEDKWKSGMHELMGKGDAIYGMRAEESEPRGGIYFNKRLLEEAGINPDDLYTWQEDGTWTWDKFEELCAQVQRDTDNDGIIDIYAMTQQASQFYAEAVYSNGGEFVGKDEDGLYYNDLESSETMEALNWAVSMREKYDLPQPEDSEWDYFIDEFKNGNAVFWADESYRGGEIIDDMEDEFGFVCFPMGPQATDYTNCYNDNPFVIPACYDADKAWKIAFAYNLYTEPIPGFEDAETWKASYYSDFCDTEAVDLTLERMMNNGMITYHTMIPSLSLGSDILWNLGNADETGEVATPAQKAEALRNTWQSYLDEANK
jgi:ABC-type glycerol-3-phosphate transport system substrate-binding protein